MPIPTDCRIGYGLMNCKFWHGCVQLSRLRLIACRCDLPSHSHLEAGAGTADRLSPRSLHLLALLTDHAHQTPDEQAFAAIRASVDAGSTMLNSGEFYGQPEPTLNLQLLKRFYDAYPEYVEKTYLSVKGGLSFTKDGAIDFTPNASEENLRRSVTNINKVLGGKKKMDMFEMARVDQKIPIEDAMRNLLKLRDEGHFKDIALSESAAETIRRAAKVAPIAGVEVE